jgi:N-carbamoylputrescine amidase
MAPDGTLQARTRKVHIPAFPGYYEDQYFDPGDTGFPVIEAGGARFGFPTCWDQWFPELARVYSLQGAEVLVYPTAIGSEPHLDSFDTQPMWEQIIAANGLANATFMVAINRIGAEDGLTFYGSSFISDPYGRVLLRAPRDRDAVLVADLDLDQRRDWLGFGLLRTRRPAAYSLLTQTEESSS